MKYGLLKIWSFETYGLLEVWSFENMAFWKYGLMKCGSFDTYGLLKLWSFDTYGLLKIWSYEVWSFEIWSFEIWSFVPTPYIHRHKFIKESTKQTGMRFWYVLKSTSPYLLVKILLKWTTQIWTKFFLEILWTLRFAF